MYVRCLGTFMVCMGDSEIVIQPCRRARLLIAFLVNANSVLSIDQISAELWGEDPCPGTANSLHAQVSRLRKTLTGWAPVGLSTQYPGYVLTIDESSLDITRFTHLAEACRRHWPADPVAVVEHARQALALWLGSPFPGHQLGALGQMAKVRLEETRLATLEMLMDASLELGQHRQSVGELRQLVVAHPFQEKFYEQLMLALYRSGRQGEALAAFEQARSRLSESLGVDPSPRLHQRMTQILRHDPALWSPCDEHRLAAG